MCRYIVCTQIVSIVLSTCLQTLDVNQACLTMKYVKYLTRSYICIISKLSYLAQHIPIETIDVVISQPEHLLPTELHPIGACIIILASTKVISCDSIPPRSFHASHHLKPPHPPGTGYQSAPSSYDTTPSSTTKTTPPAPTSTPS